MGPKAGSSLPSVIVIYGYNLRDRALHASWEGWGLGCTGEQDMALVT